MDRDAILAQIRTLTLIEETNVSDAEIVEIINNGMYEISLASEWPWLQETSTVTTVADQQAYTLPADFEFAIALVDDDNDTTVPFIAVEEFFRRYGNDTGNTSTTPNFWTIWEDSIYLTPIPSANDTDRYTLYYYETVTLLTTGGTSPAFHAAFHPILVEYAKWKLYEREEYYDQSERSFITYARYLSRMIEWYQRQVKRAPYIAGDGSFRREGDPNLPWLRQV